MFEKLPIFFQYVISSRVLEISMSAERSKCAGGVQTIRPIGHNFRVFDIQWLPRGSKLEQNEKETIYFKFRPLVIPIVEFSRFTWDVMLQKRMKL